MANYGYELKIPEDSRWRDKINILSIFIPLIREKEEVSGFINKSEIVDKIAGVVLNDIDAEKNGKNEISKQFTFFQDKEFYEVIFNNTTFLDIIKKLRDYKECKSYIEAVNFYMEDIFSNLEFQDGDIQQKEENKCYDTFKNYLGEMDIIKDKFLPETKNDWTVLYNNSVSSNIYNSSKDEDIKKYHILSFLGGYPEQFADRNYSKVIDQETIDSLVDNDILIFESFSKIFLQLENIPLESIENNRDNLEHFLDYFIEQKTSTKPVRQKVIKVLETYKNDNDEKVVLLMNILNTVLLDSTDAKNNIKAEWMGSNLETDAGNVDGEDDPFNF